jgi:hypothetical protein
VTLNRLFTRLRDLVSGPPGGSIPGRAPTRPAPPVIADFDGRVEALCRYAEHAAFYEDDLIKARQEVEQQIQMLEGAVERALKTGHDRDALEFVRLMVRLRPQIELLNREIHNFHAVAAELILRTNTLVLNLDEARNLAQVAGLNPDATLLLDRALTNLTRYFVMLERVAGRRRQELPDRLAALMMQVVDNRTLDMELARYILQRRRALGTGDVTGATVDE